MTEDRIEQELFVNAPPDRVWSLLTEAEHLGTWFGDAGAEIELEPGGAMALHWTEMGTARGRVERVEPPQAFSFRWAPFKDPAGEEPTDGNSTLVEFTLEPRDQGTNLRVVESGFEGLDCSPEQRITNRQGNTQGWEHELGELAAHLAKVTA